MDLVVGAIASINHGVALVAHGEERRGLLEFQQAVVAMCVVDQSLAEDSSAMNRPGIRIDLEPQLQPSEFIEHQTSGHFHVHHRLFGLCIGSDESAAQGPVSLESTLRTASMAVLFNMATVIHRCGSHTGNSYMHLRAISIYEMALQIQQANDDDASLLLQCLALNNLAHLYFERSEFHKSFHCLVIMKDALQTNDRLDHYLSDFDASEIRVNVYHRRFPSTAHAA
jgi:hypothetical protein